MLKSNCKQNEMGIAFSHKRTSVTHIVMVKHWNCLLVVVVVVIIDVHDVNTFLNIEGIPYNSNLPETIVDNGIQFAQKLLSGTMISTSAETKVSDTSQEFSNLFKRISITDFVFFTWRPLVKRNKQRKASWWKRCGSLI